MIAPTPTPTPIPAPAPAESFPPDEDDDVKDVWVLEVIEAGVLLIIAVKVEEDEVKGWLEVWEIEAEVYVNPVAGIEKKVANSLGAGK